MYFESKDNIPTIAAIGLVAYVCANIAHHALGHGAACLIEGGRINLLSSVFVNCSLTGTSIDLAGPFANLALGLIAALGTHIVDRRFTATRLYCILLAAFNLLWFGMQLAFSAVSRTDDWAWAMQELHVVEPVRYGMMAVGSLVYVLTVRFIGSELVPFGHPLSRARIIVGTAWLSAGAIACATAAFDHYPAAAILRHAAPQSLLVSIGILFVPGRSARLSTSDEAQATLGLSIPWIIAAVIFGVVSIVCLGPGIAIVI
jgi:hypothetical protein